MDARLIAIAEACLEGSHAKTMSFPEIVALLAGSGFDGYAVDYRRGTTSYFLPDGDSVMLENPPHDDVKVAEAFDREGIAGEVRWAQADPPDYSYAAFSSHVKAMGCAGYLVSFPGRRVLYYGRTAETHVEFFPS